MPTGSEVESRAQDPAAQQYSPETYRFDIADEAGWRGHLASEGFVVLRGCVGEPELEAARDMLWSDLEAATVARRDDMQTWADWKLNRRGFVIDGKVTQGRGAWFLKSLPSVRGAFERIWEDDDLITSMDSLLVWRPWWRAEEVGVSAPTWVPRTEGLHVDQNPLFKPGPRCVQGMLPLYDVTEQIGGLEVVPRSHSDSTQASLVENCGDRLRSRGNFIVVPKDMPLGGPRVLLLASAGDLILWDSRLMHGGFAAEHECPRDSEGPSCRLARMSLTVCMTPRRWAPPEVLEARRAMFQQGQTTNHWPHEPRVQSKVCRDYAPITLTAEQEALL